MRAFVIALLLAAPAFARDRAILIYPRERWTFRRMFYTTHQRALIAQLKKEYDVEVHEQVADEKALFDVDVTGAKLLVLSAHGDPFAMSFAGKHARTLDSSDRARLAALFAKLDPHATILLQSCETGRGFAHLVKELAGESRRVIAAKGDIPRDGVVIGSLAPFDVTITCSDGSDCTLRL